MFDKIHLDISYFFSEWKDSKIRELFLGEKYVWDPLKKMCKFLHQMQNSLPRSNVSIGKYCSIDDNVSIGEGTIIRNNSYIEGPTYIGKNCKIGPFAQIRKSVIDDGADLATTEIKGSIVGSGVMSMHRGFVGDSILGRNVNIGAGYVSANSRFDGEEIRVEDIPTGLKQFGAIIGDHSKMGVQSRTMPGTLIGKNVWLFPDQEASGFIESNTKIKKNHPMVYNAF